MTKFGAGSSTAVQWTVSSAKFSASVTNFVYMINVADIPSAFINKCRSDGMDIRCYTTSGTLLDRYLDEFVKSPQAGTLWIRMNGSNSADNVIQLECGSGTSYSDNSSTFTSSGASYQCAFSMSESGTPLYDRCATSNLDTDAFSGFGQTGKIGKCIYQDGTANTIGSWGLGNFERTDTFSGSVWVKLGATNQLADFFGKFTVGTSIGWVFQTYQDKINIALFNSYPSNILYLISSSTYTDTSAFHLLHFTYDGSSDKSGLKVYRDGSEITMVDNGNTLSASILNAAAFYVGTRASSYNMLNGYTDELRVATVVLSSAWVSAEYDNQNSPSTFGTFGAVDSIVAMKMNYWFFN